MSLVLCYKYLLYLWNVEVHLLFQGFRWVASGCCKNIWTSQMYHAAHPTFAVWLIVWILFRGVQFVADHVTSILWNNNETCFNGQIFQRNVSKPVLEKLSWIMHVLRLWRGKAGWTQVESDRRHQVQLSLITVGRVLAWIPRENSLWSVTCWTTAW